MSSRVTWTRDRARCCVLDHLKVSLCSLGGLSGERYFSICEMTTACVRSWVACSSPEMSKPPGLKGNFNIFRPRPCVPMLLWWMGTTNFLFGSVLSWNRQPGNKQQSCRQLHSVFKMLVFATDRLSLLYICLITIWKGPYRKSEYFQHLSLDPVCRISSQHPQEHHQCFTAFQQLLHLLCLLPPSLSPQLLFSLQDFFIPVWWTYG